MRVAVSLLRGYWSAALLGLAAVVLLVLGAPARAALAGARFALVGAAVTRAIDLAKERRAEAAQADANRRRDLDETRRVAYMALQANSRAPELVATIVNALAHHGLAVDPEESARHVQNLASNLPIDRTGASAGCRNRSTASTPNSATKRRVLPGRILNDRARQDVSKQRLADGHG